MQSWSIHIPSSPGQRYFAWFNWSIATFFCLFQFFLQASASVMAAPWAAEFKLDTVEVSHLSAAFFYSYLVMQIPVGFLNDRFSVKGILTLGAFLVAVGCALLAYTHNTALAYTARIIMGIGSSFGFVSMLYTCARWFLTSRFSLMVGLSEAVGMIGVALLTLLTAGLLSHIGWRGTMYACAIIAMLVMIASYGLVRDQKKENDRLTTPPPPSIRHSLRMVLAQRNVWIASIFGFFGFSIVNAITSLWGVPFLQQVYHLSVSLSAAITGMILYGLAIGTPLFGWLSHRMGRHKPLMLLGSALTTVVLLVIIFMPNLSVCMLFVLFFFTGVVGSSYIQCFSISKEATPFATHGVSLAVTNTIIMIGAPMMQVAIGYLLSNHFFGISHSIALTYRLAMGIIPAGIALSFFVALTLKNN